MKKNDQDGLEMLTFKLALLHKEAALDESLSVLTTAGFGCKSEVTITLRAKLHEVRGILEDMERETLKEAGV